jgi:organic hydroperoxide reductase OsmC/OhrA
MRISASLKHSSSEHVVQLRTGVARQTLTIPPRAAGDGSAINGGELLMLALATCFCNDLHREAAARGLRLDAVEVEASAEFAAVGRAASDIRYRARIQSQASDDAIEALLKATDAVAEVHNTIRCGAQVTRVSWSERGFEAG